MKLEDAILGEKEKAHRAIRRLPKLVRDFYEPHYSLEYGGGDGREGRFVGLVCKCCNHWQDAGHAKDCPVRRIVRIPGEP